MSEPAALITAFFLGLWTSLSPCPLTTNIAAVSYILKKLEHRHFVVLNGFLYTAGRAAAYTAMGAAVVMGIVGSHQISQFLNHYLNKLLGPGLILVGMVLLELLTFSPKGAPIEKIARKTEGLGALGSLLLGIVFALSFCPISAAIFFGSLITLAVKAESPLLIPAVFGIATALPVAVFACVIGFAAGWIGNPVSYTHLTLPTKA